MMGADWIRVGMLSVQCAASSADPPFLNLPMTLSVFSSASPEHDPVLVTHATCASQDAKLPYSGLLSLGPVSCVLSRELSTFPLYLGASSHRLEACITFLAVSQVHSEFRPECLLVVITVCSVALPSIADICLTRPAFVEAKSA